MHTRGRWEAAPSPRARASGGEQQSSPQEEQLQRANTARAQHRVCNAACAPGAPWKAEQTPTESQTRASFSSKHKLYFIQGQAN